ncbi:MAG: YbhB/YbcL family Raf kinase inhibitor-like protein [Proteobacteria bacterium]|nr:YbhB/YbcL family Raf kinase inhibitor-like protein [Pseudomonadota bacterium]
MKLVSESFVDMGTIPARCAFAEPDQLAHLRLSANRNPQVGWSGLPSGTHSLVLLCHDPDVPSRADDVNQEGRTIPAGLPRVDFFHWVLVDLAPFGAPIAEGEFSDGVKARGKAGPQAARGTRQGLNGYTQWFAGDKEMAGDYFGYDGPCPPWNDEIVHRYVFTLYALNVKACPVSGRFNGPDVLRAIEGCVLDRAVLTGKYSLNLALRP